MMPLIAEIIIKQTWMILATISDGLNGPVSSENKDNMNITSQF